MIPLSEQLRPTSFNEIFGQDHLVGEKGYITKIVKKGKPLSLLLCGPPGCGKTTIARLYAQSFHLPFQIFSAVSESISELKKHLQSNRATPLFTDPLLVFVDEIHRLNKAQQDIFLPFIEDGSLVLIGATTENPSFVLNNALLSRFRVLILRALSNDALEAMITRYEAKTKPLGLTKEGRAYVIAQSQGDGRHLVNLLENLEQEAAENLSIEALAQICQKKTALYDRDRENHYELISALHKAVRGSDPDAALYWFTRMLAGGEDPLFISRRLLRMASEDIGLADPHAVGFALQADEVYRRLGSPEGELALAQTVLYLSLSPKSNAAYLAYNAAKELAAQTGHLNPPKHIVNAPTDWMSKMGYGTGYQYDHDTPDSFSGQNYFPDTLTRQEFYRPVERGFEREMKKRLAYFTKLRKLLASNPADPV